jgi:hypothetical protein
VNEPGPTYFTRDEANAALPALRRALQRLRDAKDLLTDAEAHEVLSEAAPTNGGGEPGAQVGEAFLQVRRLLASLQGQGIVIRDIDRGLIDFPTVIDGEDAYLCWELGEESVDYWHGPEEGFTGRRPLD